MEVWKDIVSRDGIYIGRYQVSDQGRVRAHPDAKGRGMKPGRILFQSMDDRGYPQCELYLGGRCTVKVHRMVAEAFLGPRCEGMTINHIDGDKLNNNVTNLEYVTNKDNQWHAHRIISTRGGVVVHGEKMSIPEAIEKYGAPGLKRSRVDARIRRHGWSPEMALMTPPGRTGRPTDVERMSRG
jgi:hypothetical protein